MTRDLQDKAQAHIQHNEWQEAINYLEQARQTEPKNTYVLGPLSFCYSRLGQHEKTIGLCEELCQLQPDLARWPYMIGYQYYDQQQYEEAIKHFDRALKIEPNYIVVLYRKGYALSQVAGKTGPALTTYEKCRTAYHKLADEEAKKREKEHYVDACYQQGKLFLETRNYRLAQERLRDAIALKPDHADAHYSLGKTYCENEQFDEAIIVLHKAQELSSKPQHYVIDRLAQAYAGANRLDESVRIYERMPPFIRNRPYVLRNMGEVYIKLQRWQEAQRILTEAVQQEQRNHNGHYLLGLVFKELGHWDKAARSFEKANQLRQKNYNCSFTAAEEALATLNAEHPEGAKLARSENMNAPVSPMGRPVGRVKRYLADRGFGFLQTERGTELFFHIKNVKGTNSVVEGDYLEYTQSEGKKGPEATNLCTVPNAKQIAH